MTGILMAVALTAATVAYETDSLKPFAMTPAPVPEKFRNPHHVGCPSITISPGGRLWCAWLAGGKDGEGDSNFAYLQTSGDGGRTWTEAVQVVDADGPLRTLDPGLWTDPKGNVWFYWGQLYGFWDGRAGLFAALAKDPERADTAWTTPRRLTDGYMNNKPVALSSGEWVFPVEFMQFDEPLEGDCKHLKPNKGPYAHPECGTSARMHGVYITSDGGRTFRRGGIAALPKAQRDCPEDMIVERRDGSLLMLARTKYGIGESVSTDKGRTWTPMKHSGIWAPNSRFFFRRLASGALLLVKNQRKFHGEPLAKPYSLGRNHLFAYLSDDDGKTWTEAFTVDSRTDVSYPDGCQDKDGMIHIVYDHGRTSAREILHAVFSEADVRAGKIVTKGSRLRDIVYKGRAEALEKDEKTWLYNKESVSFCGPEIVPAAKEKTYRAEVEVRIDSAQTFTVSCPDAQAVPWVRAHVKRWFRQDAKVVAAPWSGAGWTIGDEGYRLKARPDGIRIEAKTLQGVRYALITIRHVAERNSVGRRLAYYRLAQLDVTDYPALKFRGLHFCWFPEQSATLMERQIRAAAFHKFNYVVIEPWGVFRSTRHPWYGWKDGPMTKPVIRHLVEVARDLGVTLVPQINVFGHATASRGHGKHAALDFGEEWQPLFEPINGWNWCLSNPDARAVVRELVAELHEAFGNPPYFHIGCDEAGGPVCASCRASDYAKLVCEHVTAICDMLRARGARTMLWQDQLLKKGDPRWKGFYAYGSAQTAKLVAALPKDAVICDWYYEAPPAEPKDGKSRYPTLTYFSKDCGFDVLTCPWNVPSGIAAQAKFAAQNGLMGLMGTTWHHFGGDRFPLMVQSSAHAAWECGDRVLKRRNGGNFSMVWRWCGWDMDATDYRETGWHDNQVSRDVLNK